MAKRRAAGKERAIADLHGDGSRSFVEVMDSWSLWITKQVSPKTAKRYAYSLDQLARCLDGKSLNAIDGRLVAEIIRERSAVGMITATIKRDLVALSSVLNFSIDQGWRATITRYCHGSGELRNGEIRSFCRNGRTSTWSLSAAPA